MKLSPGTIGTILFTAAGIAVFVLMAKRPVMGGSAMNFGMPITGALAEGKKPETTEPETTAPKESLTPATDTVITPSTTEESMPATSKAAPTEIEEITTPTTSDEAMPSIKELEANIEEMLNENKLSDTPSAESTMDETTPAN